MTSPRLGGPGLHQRKNTFAWLVALATVLTAAPCWAQTTGSAPVAGLDSVVALPLDSASTDGAAAPSAGIDSAAAPSAAAPSAGIDSVGTDSAAVAPGDTLPRQGQDSAAPPARPAPPPAPVDSALGAACGATPGDRPDLLLVTFRPFTTDSERSVVAREVGGTLMGMSQHAAPGSWYLLVPGSAGDPTVADRLILQSPVLEVGATRCPS